VIHIKDHNQQHLFDPWDNLGPKRRQLLEESWAGLFRQELLPTLPVHKLAAHFTDDVGRPTKELTTCMAVAVFQQIFDLTDKETQEKLAFDVQWHYALNLPEESDAVKYLSLKTLWTMRQILTQHALDKDIFNAIGERLAEVFDVNTETQRLDSVHIQSNMKKLGRLGLVVETIKKFLRNLKRQEQELWTRLDQSIVDKYASKDSKSVFSRVKPSDSSKTLTEVCQDVLYLVEQFQNMSKITRMHSYKLLERVLAEQCHLQESDGEKTVAVKTPKEIPADSLQNPSDPDASYDGHKGQGYQVQVMESYDATAQRKSAEDDTEENQDNETSKDLRLITHVAVEPAHKQDSDAVVPAIESTDDINRKPQEIGADAAYGGDENVTAAKKQGVALISPLKGRPKSNNQIELAAHQFHEDYTLRECIAGVHPVEHHTNGQRQTGYMPRSRCEHCEYQKHCHSQEGVHYYYFRYTDPALRSSSRRVFEQTAAFQEKYRYRAGIEATMSEYDRKTGVKQLRVRGMAHVRYAAVMKLSGINIFRATRFRGAKKSAKRARQWAHGMISGANEHICRLVEQYSQKNVIFKTRIIFHVFRYEI